MYVNPGENSGSVCGSQRAKWPSDGEPTVHMILGYLDGPRTIVNIPIMIILSSHLRDRQIPLRTRVARSVVVECYQSLSILSTLSGNPYCLSCQLAMGSGRDGMCLPFCVSFSCLFNHMWIIVGISAYSSAGPPPSSRSLPNSEFPPWHAVLLAFRSHPFAHVAASYSATTTKIPGDPRHS